MKMVLAVYNMAVDEEVMEAVRQAGVKCYTKWPRVLGEGQTTGPRLDDHIWPGANCVTMMVVPDELAPKVMETLKGLRDTIGQKEGVKAFLLNVEQQLA
jgi:nitrogen regulatory protein PII